MYSMVTIVNNMWNLKNKIKQNENRLREQMVVARGKGMGVGRNR